VVPVEPVVLPVPQAVLLFWPPVPLRSVQSPSLPLLAAAAVADKAVMEEAVALVQAVPEAGAVLLAQERLGERSPLSRLQGRS
jgi:hypothetical protein